MCCFVFLSRTLLLVSLATTVAFAASPARPNVIFIVADDLGYGELGTYGGREIPTPNLDGLARSGVRFTNGYVTASFCGPSRAALLTGRYQARFGYESNVIGAANADSRNGLSLTERTIADHMRSVGYATGLVGKWHQGGTAAFHPLRRGFDEFFGFLHEGHYYVPHPWTGVTTWLRRFALPDGGKGRWVSPDGRIVWTTHMGGKEPDYNADNPILRDSQPVNETENLTAAFTREACDFIRRHQTQPFFLYLAYNAVHSPLQGAERSMAKFRHITDVQRRIFAAMLSDLDDGVGTVLATLRETGRERDTLVVFLSDNGGATRELTSSNAPLRGEKGQVYEGGIRVPFILRWPARLPAGKVVDTPVISMDLTATALAAAQATVDSTAQDGIDLMPLLAGADAKASSRAFFWRAGPRAALRHGDWKIVREGGRPQARSWQLFNLAQDVAEGTDLAAKEPERLADLVAQWEKWSAAHPPARP